MKALNNARTVTLSRNQFVSIKVNGLYSYYKKPIQLAKLICEKGRLSASYNDVNEYKILPYAINMESLFEYYIRYQIRKQDVYSGRNSPLRICSVNRKIGCWYRSVFSAKSIS